MATKTATPKRNPSGQFVGKAGPKGRSSTDGKKTGKKRASTGAGALTVKGVVAMVKTNAVPMLLAVICCAAGAVIIRGKPGSFNWGAVAVSTLAPALARRFLKKQISEDQAKRAMAFALLLSLIWEGARAALMRLPVKGLIEKVEAAAGTLQLGKGSGPAAVLDQSGAAIPGVQGYYSTPASSGREHSYTGAMTGRPGL